MQAMLEAGKEESAERPPDSSKAMEFSTRSPHLSFVGYWKRSGARGRGLRPWTMWGAPLRRGVSAGGRQFFSAAQAATRRERPWGRWPKRPRKGRRFDDAGAGASDATRDATPEESRGGNVRPECSLIY
jgi:hypothetical protein